MGKALTLLHDAFVDVQGDGALLLDDIFIMNIFSPLYEEIPPLKEYLDYHFEEKEGNVIGSCKEHERVLAIDEAMAELFFPQKMENRQTTEFCKELAVGVATTLLTELTDPKKSTSNYINDGLLAFNNLTDAEKKASLGMRANNDPSESMFATIMGVMSVVKRVGEMMSLQRMVLSMPCQRSSRIHCLPLQRRAGRNVGRSLLRRCVGSVKLGQRKQQMRLQ